MASTEQVRLLDAIWIRGARVDRQRNSRSERQALLACGAQIEVLENEQDHTGLERLRQLLHRSDRHVVLARLLSHELKALYPLLRERKNFSLVLDDWWSSPYWFTRNARYILFRNFNGLAVRGGLCPLARPEQLPLFPLPETWSLYGAAGLLLRLPTFALWPLWAAWNAWRRQQEQLASSQLIYFPFPIAEADVPLGRATVDLDFSNLGGTFGIWLMRDPHASALLNFTNLYHDRKLLADALARVEDQPYKIFDWRRHSLSSAAAPVRNPAAISFEDYCALARRSRFTIASGGLHNTSVPKFLEFACLGTPMIGRLLPYEYPWLEQCLFPIDPVGSSPGQLRQKFDEALSLQRRYRESTEALRPRLLRDYHLERVLHVAQEQIEGRPIPEGYLKPGVNTLLTTPPGTAPGGSE